MRQLLTFSLAAIFAFFLLTGCTGTTATKTNTPAFDTAAMKVIIAQKDKNWAKAIVGLDSAAMVNNFTKDGKIFAPNAAAIVGRPAISAFVSEVLKFGINEYKDETTALYGNNDNLVEEGIYTMGDGKGHTIDKGKYIAIWRKESGDWKIFTDMFNTSVPLAPVKK